MLPAWVLENGDAATRGAELRDEYDVRVAASRAAVYPTSGQAQLLRLAKRFPLLELVTPREESQVTTPQAKQLLPPHFELDGDTFPFRLAFVQTLGDAIEELEKLAIYPAKHFVTTQDKIEKAATSIPEYERMIRAQG